MTEMPLITPEVKTWIEWYMANELAVYGAYYLDLLGNLAKKPEYYRPDLVDKARDAAYYQVDGIEMTYRDMHLYLFLTINPEELVQKDNLSTSTVDTPF